MTASHPDFNYAIGISPQILLVGIVGESRVFDSCLMFSQFASEVWNKVKKRFDIHLCRKNFRSTKQWLFDFIDRASPEQSTVLAITVWHIWEARNTARNEPEAPPPKHTTARARGYIDMIFHHLFKSAVVDPQVTPPSSSSWTPPPCGTLLFSADAAVDLEQNVSAVGVVVQDHTGQCVAAAS